MSSKGALKTLHSEIDNCEVCRTRGLSIIKSVGVERGEVGVKVMAVGIAPSSAVLKSKKAFEGNSFSRLSKWFADAGFQASEAQLRKALYLTSFNKCAVTPDSNSNRKLLWTRCQQFLWRQIEVIQPRLILLLGVEVANTIIPSSYYPKILLGMRCTTDQVFDQDLFPPITNSATWLVLPHPSGLNRAMNDKVVSARVIAS